MSHADSAYCGRQEYLIEKASAHSDCMTHTGLWIDSLGFSEVEWMNGCMHAWINERINGVWGHICAHID